MMGKKNLSNEDISAVCLELSVLVHAGLEIGDGLHLLAEDAEGPARSVLDGMAKQADAGVPLSAAMESAGVFPGYVCSLTRVGEQAGRMEEALEALSSYYDGRSRLAEQIRSALLYPAMLLVLMLVVIGVLLVKVLPVFNQVFESLGGQMTGLAGGLLALGRGLDTAMPVLWVLLAAAAAFLVAFAASDSFREGLLRRWRSRHGERGLTGQVAAARFAQALAMGLQSGLPVEQALELASSFHQESEAAVRRCHDCRSRLDQGAGLAEALRESGLLAPAYCRMLAIGVRGGTGDSVMREIARRMDESAERSIEERVSRVEPTLVIVASMLVGVILLSVMLPLMNIMAAIG